MNRARHRIQRALALLQSGVLDIWHSDEVSGRLKRLWEKLRHHPYLVTSVAYVTTNFPIWKARYHESREFKDRVWYTGIFGIFLVMVLYFSIGEGPEVPMFKVKEDEIHFKKGAPQLAFIRAEPVTETLLPVGAPIPARVAMDDSRTTPVHPSLSGRVVQQHAQLGDRVEAGDPLVTIDSPDYGTALTDWHKADADAKRKKAHYQRAKELLAGEAIARRDYEVAEADSKIADAEAKRAYLRISNLVPYGQPAPDSERLTLRAPVSGVVAHINVNPGREVRSDHPEPVAIVSDLSHVWVVVDAPEQSAADVHVGDTMLVTFDNLPGQVFKADVTRISPLLDPKMRRVQIRAEIDNPDMKLKPEMFGRAQLSDPDAPMSVRIPISALITHGIYTTVFVETEPGVFRRQRVEVAYQDNQWLWLKPGADIKPGDRVVTIGALLLSSELSQSAK
jgi:cobalt-zinc-cadmium efflux system membrane fusion protein